MVCWEGLGAGEKGPGGMSPSPLLCGAPAGKGCDLWALQGGGGKDADGGASPLSASRLQLVWLEADMLRPPPGALMW